MLGSLQKKKTQKLRTEIVTKKWYLYNRFNLYFAVELSFGESMISLLHLRI